MAKASKGKETAPAGPQPIGSVFNTLQFIALGALITSVLLLVMALSNYGFKLTAN